MAETWDAQGYIRISGWKQIAVYLGEEIEVVQSWAHERGLPLHHWADADRGRIFAYAVELDKWMYRQVLDGNLQEGESATRPGLVGRGLHPQQVAAEIHLSHATLPETAPASPALTPPPPTPSATHTLADRHSGVIGGFLVAATAVFVLVAVVAILHAFTTTFPPSASIAVTAHPLAPPPASSPLAGPTVSHLLTTAASARLERHRPNRQTATLYRQARSSWERRTPAALRLARMRFAEAIRHDPLYAQAYAGLAETYFLSRQYDRIPDRSAFLKAEAAARTAVALDPQSCEAHRSLAFVLSYWTWNMQAAEQEFQRAIALDPNDAEAHHWYATS